LTGIELHETSALATLQDCICHYEEKAETPRVASKQTYFCFGSNRNKPKRDLFQFCFGLFRELKKIFFGLFPCFETVLERTETKNRRFETNRKGRLIHSYTLNMSVDVDIDMDIDVDMNTEVDMDMDMDIDVNTTWIWTWKWIRTLTRFFFLFAPK
jgi:hypothetical protein